MDRNTKFRMVCFGLAALCFAVVSYGHFCNGERRLGVAFLCVAAAQLVVVALTFAKSKKK